jgi:N-acetylneuraminic acid mutarotase
VVYDPLANAWSAIADMPDARANLGAAALNGKIYVVGGQDGTSTSKSGAVYDPATDSWSATASMSAARTWLGLAALEGRLFAVGGSYDHGQTILKSAEAFTPFDISL